MQDIIATPNQTMQVRCIHGKSNPFDRIQNKTKIIGEVSRHFLGIGGLEPSWFLKSTDFPFILEPVICLFEYFQVPISKQVSRCILYLERKEEGGKGNRWVNTLNFTRDEWILKESRKYWYAKDGIVRLTGNRHCLYKPNDLMWYVM